MCFQLQVEKISFLNRMIELSEDVNGKPEESRRILGMRMVLELRADILSEIILLNGKIQQSRLIIYVSFFLMYKISLKHLLK